MRIEASRWKYLAFVLGLGACFFDPKATGTTTNTIGPSDGSVPLLDGSSGASGTSGAQAGDGIGIGVGGMSGGGAGVGGPASTSGTGGVSPDGGTPRPPLLVNGESCTDDARCMSGHCDNVCCEKGSECCKTVSDCTTQGGLGMSCDDRSMCRGSAGKITCTTDFKCVTINGARNDTACSNRTEANDCGFYPSVFCLGGELQQGAPPCATSCANDSECDTNAHCNNGQCEPDKENGQNCTRPEDCTAGFCKNIVNGAGICCGLVGDCCATEDDCPDTYRSPAACTDPTSCRGFETIAMCISNICSQMAMPANNACDGMPGPTCGLYQDITCMSARSNACRTSCSGMGLGQCDANAYCDGRQCLEKKPNGQACANTLECMSGNCNNGMCCGMGRECCKSPADCTMRLDAQCLDQGFCRGDINEVVCEMATCRYTGTRIPDDRACKGPGNDCSNARDIMCNGTSAQSYKCADPCMNANDCDSGFQCLALGDVKHCMLPSGGASGMGMGMAGRAGGDNGN